MNLAGRSTLVAATLSAIPVYVSMAMCLSPWAIECIDRCRRAFLWTGGPSVAGGQCKVAWRLVCAPKELGGLGLIDLRRLGVALRLRWEWLRRTDPSRPWHALPSKPERAVQAFFKVAVHVEVGNGAEALFWTDRWIDGRSISHIAPCLLVAVPARRRRRTVASALTNNAWVSDIQGAQTVQVIVEYLVLIPEVKDKFIWRFGSDGVYSASSACKAMFVGSTHLRGAKQLWKASVPPRVKFFFWLAVHERCWTASRRKKRGLQDSDACALCNQEPETMNHLLVHCVYTREV